MNHPSWFPILQKVFSPSLFLLLLQMGFSFGSQEYIAQLKQRRNPFLGGTQRLNLSLLWCLCFGRRSGDFNVIWWTKEKLNYRRPAWEMWLFNDFIEKAALVDFPLSNDLYNWSDYWEFPTHTHWWIPSKGRLPYKIFQRYGKVPNLGLSMRCTSYVISQFYKFCL